MNQYLSKMLFHREVRGKDFDALKAKLDENLHQECFERINDELRKIGKSPLTAGKLCDYEPLKSGSFRKVKLFSSKALQTMSGQTPDLRIIYRYNATKDKIEVLAIGYRVKERPRPPGDVYSVAESREFDFKD